MAAALLSPPRRKLADLLAAMPDVGRDTDFARQPEGGDDADFFVDTNVISEARKGSRALLNPFHSPTDLAP